MRTADRPLFSPRELRAKKSQGRAKLRRRKLAIPDGLPKFGESEIDRLARYASNEVRIFYSEIVQSVKARMDLTRYRGRHELVSCPWARLEPCTDECRCKGHGVITVALLRRHYAEMLELYGALA